MPRLRRALISDACSNAECENEVGPDFKDWIKCPGCRIAKYCSKNCQRAHVPFHRDYCLQWPVNSSQSSRNTSLTNSIPSDVKEKQRRFMFLIRGLPDYVKSLLDEYVRAKQTRHFRGCIEFYFRTYEQLCDSVRLIESLPVREESVYFPMPYERTYRARGDGGPVGQSITLRLIYPQHKDLFKEKVVKRMRLAPPDGRENLEKLLGRVGDSEKMFLICCSLQLEIHQCTHSYEFIYENLSGYNQ